MRYQDPALISRSDIVRHGIWLGVLADLLAVVLYWVGAVIAAYLTGSRASQGPTPVEGFAIVAAVFTFLLLLLPAMAGGALVAWVLAKLQGWHHLYLYLMMILVGAGTALVVTFVVLKVVGLVLHLPPRSWDSSMPWLPAIALLVGGLHGWLMAKWLRGTGTIR